MKLDLSHFRVGLALCLSAVGMARPAEAGVIMDADAEDATVLSGTYTVMDSGQDLEAALQGTGLPCYISNINYRGGHSFKFQVNPSLSSDGEASDRSELYLNWNLRFNTQTYSGMTFYIPTTCPNPASGKSIIIMQWWQTSGVEPPLSVSWGSDGKWRVTARGASGTTNNVYSSPSALAKGVWHRFVFRTTFNPSSGNVKVWYNDTMVKEWNGPLGYTAGSQRTLHKFGLYRWSTDYVNTHSLYFDNVRHATTYQEATP